MAKKNQKKVNELVEGDKITEEVLENDAIEEETSEAIIENNSELVEGDTELVNLEILVDFTDKDDDTKHYKKDDVIPFKKNRANELLADSRKLVKLASK